jgi:hypothetical protein
MKHLDNWLGEKEKNFDMYQIDSTRQCVADRDYGEYI